MKTVVKAKTRVSRRLLRAVRTRRHLARLKATRLVVHMTGKHTYAQIISPQNRVLVSVSTKDKSLSSQYSKANGANIAAATFVGEQIAKKANSMDINSLSFDRGGRQYVGRVKALAEGARGGGLVF